MEFELVFHPACLLTAGRFEFAGEIVEFVEQTAFRLLLLVLLQKLVADTFSVGKQLYLLT
jgi:hypothetical protein